MMYEILNKIFGWDYIYWQTAYDYGIARIRVTESGRKFYVRGVLSSRIVLIYSYDQVEWLTCKPDKYFITDIKEAQNEQN